jgi:hypothetical protein
MAKVERIREVLHGPLTEDYVRERLEENWKLVAVEWERESGGEGSQAAPIREEVPYGMKIAGDCLHLEENPSELRVLELILDSISMDKSLSVVASELNRSGFRTRSGSPWTQVAVFNLLPRLIDAAPEIRGVVTTAR